MLGGIILGFYVIALYFVFSKFNNQEISENITSNKEN